METVTSKVLIVIPCFNEEKNVVALDAALKAVKVDGFSLHPLFVNDASKDKTKKVLEEHNLPHLDNSVNLGIGGTVQLGFRYAYENAFDFAVQMDGDGQHPPSELYKLLEPLRNKEADVTIGSRFLENEGFRSTFFRRVGIRLFSSLNNLLVGIKIKDPTSGYRAYNRRALACLIDYYPDEYPEPETIVYLAHKKIAMKEVPVLMRERQGGTSSITRLLPLYYMGKVVLNILFLHVRMKNA